MTRATSSFGILWFRQGLMGAAGLVYFLVLIAGFFYLRFPFSLVQNHLEAEMARTSDLSIHAASRLNSFPFTLIWENLSLSGAPFPLEGPVKADQFLVDLELWPLLQGDISLRFTAEKLVASVTGFPSPVVLSTVHGHLRCQATMCELKQLTGQGPEGRLSAAGEIQLQDPRSESRLALDLTITSNNVAEGGNQSGGILRILGIQPGQTSELKLKGTLGQPSMSLVSTQTLG